ncbi:clr6 histone deacetylase associated phd protein-2 cph2 [Lichtheimia corymbifera JMRC:FSU:9682]|uniref:Clr6 histone deacetylase associated phd protein-2 cph2 n=1 Tax=Lichtheimia corymbifera JMRC:FSU:9682 TaxID=1263082 RepID=A0A068RWF9_9FUNG|nr:clr6 histone deacetylase associated phd protein-2 cph2 [Lichtheimia corymbifera JMRC:FSU:9682]
MDVSEVENLSGNWYCTECEYKRKQRKNTSPAAKPSSKSQQSSISALFAKLNHDLTTRIPKMFEPPMDIVRYFDGVTMDKNGQYVDTSVIKSSKPTRTDPNDERKLKDKDDNFISCFRCRKTALRNKRIVSCDYCPLYWHMDCLDPPMTSLPNPTRKWMCPNHADHLVPRIRQPRIPKYVDASSDTPNNGVVTIIDDDKSSTRSTAEASSSSLTDTQHEKDSIIKYSDVVYRLPASSIKLDFFSHIANMRSRSKRKETSSARPPSPTKEEMKDWLEGLTSFQSQLATYIEKELDTSSSSTTTENHSSGLDMLTRAISGDDDTSSHIVPEERKQPDQT